MLWQQVCSCVLTLCNVGEKGKHAASMGALRNRCNVLDGCCTACAVLVPLANSH